MLITFVMGFSSGLPLLLTISVLQIWMRQEGVDLSTIGLMALVGLPYTLKFVWAPVLDRYVLPFLGRRRGWLALIQVLLGCAIASIGLSDPISSPVTIALLAVLVTFFSASQDIVIDAYRREHLAENELGMGSSLYVYGYRTGMLLASGGGLILADSLGFPAVFMLMGLCMGIGLLTTFLAPEPDTPENLPTTLKAAVIEPFKEYFTRDSAWTILLFILLYKLGDTLASAMTSPFYVDMGFSSTEIGVTVKLFGFWATLIGAFLGGALILKLGIYRALWFFGLLQMLSTAGFAVLAEVGYHLNMLALVIGFENLTSGMGTAAYMAFMAALTDKRFTATQYALLTSLMGIPRTLISAPSGYLAEYLGWTEFFILCTLIALPGLWLLRNFAQWGTKKHTALEDSNTTLTQSTEPKA
ncbi:MFS transporter, PAT family, beta-lactamase induction signal transducer AmpG [Oceanospirillum multiglobuliferum]|uniref:AmpG family muropeptide MFS transporter n=2 Tax=Oceanospirillum multiglobuliferum TaxID=64969 RepID=A0A1T4N6C0_9GAMM|nr:AmpG family muropeptide MFS transporter [Oceanospirillum multiglobuliferum]SJZ74721.1 MFS transporter, PAT family, beta-lactamase induction signal transducer AmpG [Oceanospirillum multiglobuliferum]